MIKEAFRELREDAPLRAALGGLIAPTQPVDVIVRAPYLTRDWERRNEFGELGVDLANRLLEWNITNWNVGDRHPVAAVDELMDDGRHPKPLKKNSATSFTKMHTIWT